MLEANKAVAHQFLDALSRGDVEQLKGTITDDVEAICTGSSFMSGTRNHADVCAAAGMLGQITKSGIEMRILNVTAEADRVCVEWEGRSTLVTGVEYNNQYHFLFTLRNGKICRVKEYLDTLLLETAFAPFKQKTA